MIKPSRNNFKEYFPKLPEITEKCPEETLDLLVGEGVRQVFQISPKECGLVRDDVGLYWKFKDASKITQKLLEKKSEVLDKIAALAEEHHLYTKGGEATKAEHYGGSETQFIWEELFKESVEEISVLLLKDTITFKELLEETILLRKNMAQCLKQEGMHGIETRRDIHEERSAGRGKSYTSLGGRYWDYFKRDDILLRLGIESLDIKEEVDIPIVGDAGGNEVTLTTIMLTPLRIVDGLDSHGGFNHTSPDQIPKVLDYVELLFQVWKDRGFTPEDELGRIAEMHWWLCHAMPYPRGSAACAEMLTEAMMHHKDLPFSGFKDGVQVDLEALTTPSLEDYVKAFPSYLK